MKIVMSVLFILFLTSEVSARPQFEPIQVYKHGPNCWNASLYATNVLEHIRFTSGGEFRTLMDSSLCRLVPSHQVEAGDIRAYRRSFPNIAAEDKEVHANVYLSPTQSINKMTFFLTALIQIEEQKNVDEKYARTPSILNLKTISGETSTCEGDQCLNQVEYYRCMNLKDQVMQSVQSSKYGNPRYSDQLLKQYFLFERISQETQEFVLTKDSTSTSKIIPLLKLYEKSLNEFCSPKSNDFYCVYFLQALHSFKEQFKTTQPSAQWIKDHFQRKPQSINTKISEITNHESFVNRFFNVCGGSLLSYVTRTSHSENREEKFYVSVRDLKSMRMEKFEIPALRELSDIRFSESCDSIEIKKTDDSDVRLQLKSWPSENLNQISEPVQFQTLKLPFGRTQIISQGRKISKQEGRQIPLKSNGDGVFVLLQNVFTQSLQFLNAHTQDVIEIQNFKPRVDAKITKKFYVSKGQIEIPAFHLSVPNPKGLLIFVHGGGCWLKESSVDIGYYSHEQADLLNAGYDLLLISYRGDKDDTFSLPRPEICGVDEVEDVAAAIEFSKRNIRSKKTFLIGESYGAYLINLLIGRFPEIELDGAISKFGVWDTVRQNAFTPNPQDLPQLYINNPKNFISNIRTPVLLLHGQGDPMVAYSNASFFTSEASRLGLKVQSFTPPQMKHGFDYGSSFDLEIKTKWHQMLLDFLETSKN